MINNIRALIIDCEKDFVRSIQQELINCFSLTFTDNADDALERVKQDKPDIIVLGYLEPPGTSFELHLKIRKDKDTQHIPLLIVDVRPEEHSRKGWTRRQGQQMNADDYTSKPISSGELRDTIERLTDQSAAKSDEASAYLEKVLLRIKKIEKTLFN
ncbi:MAG: hypothetical protein PHY28_06230 [Dehalococcoidales bacterium]|nr:hypothetical protein [Dehalococcoidales bacterium]